MTIVIVVALVWGGVVVAAWLLGRKARKQRPREVEEQWPYLPLSQAEPRREAFTPEPQPVTSTDDPTSDVLLHGLLYQQHHHQTPPPSSPVLVPDHDRNLFQGGGSGGAGGGASFDPPSPPAESSYDSGSSSDSGSSYDSGSYDSGSDPSSSG